MSGNPPKASEIDERIAAVRENLRSLVEQAAAYSGAADYELTSRRIAAQEGATRGIDQATRRAVSTEKLIRGTQ